MATRLNRLRALIPAFKNCNSLYSGLRRTLCQRTSLVGSDNHVYSPRPPTDIPVQPLGEYLMGKLQTYRDLEAVIDIPTQRRLTFTQLRDVIIRVTSGLTKLGFKKGDVISIFAFNCLEYVLLTVATLNIGVILSPVNPSSTTEELARQLANSGSVGIVADVPLSATVDQVCSTSPSVKTKVSIGDIDGWYPFSALIEDDGRSYPENVDIDPMVDTASLLYSSGTTGFPKGVMLTHHNLLANITQFLQAFPAETGVDKILAYLPFYHSYGLVVKIMYCLNAGLALAIVPKFSDKFLETMEQYKITVLHMVPPVCVYMIKHPSINSFDLSRVRVAMCGAAPIGKEQVAEFRNRTGINSIIQAYGLTETSPIVSADSDPIRLGSVGQLLTATTAKVVDLENGNCLAPGQTGEICLKGPQVMAGYYRNPEATSNTIRTEWLYSGDVGHFDEDGYLYITDRVKELIKYKSMQVAPAELEALLLTHPYVQDAAVTGIPDDVAGEVPKAFVVLKPGAPSNLKSETVACFINDKVSNHKKLRGGVEFLTEIPKSPSGKILRRVLKEKS